MVTAPKKRAATKQTAKKKSATKKATTKKAAAKAPRKKAKVKQKDTFNKKKTEGRNPARPELPQFPTSISLRNRLSMMLLSPTRFPVQMDSVAVGAARVTGLAFVFIGMLLATYNAVQLGAGVPQYSSVIQANLLAQLAGSQEQSTTTATSSVDEMSTSTDDTAAATTTPTTTAVQPRLSIPNEQYEIGTAIPITVMAEDVEGVRVFAEHGATGNRYDLGTPQQTAATWQVTWDTNATEPGVYVLYARVSGGQTDQTNWERVTLRQPVTAAGALNEMNTTEAGLAAQAEEDFLSDKVLLIAASVVISLLGLVLILLGFYLHKHTPRRTQAPRRKANTIAPQPSQ